MTTTTNLTPAQKAKITRAEKNLELQMAEMNKVTYQPLREAIDLYAPARDAIIEKAKADMDEAIQIAEDKFRTIREVACAEFDSKIKTVEKAHENAFHANYKWFLDEMAKVKAEVSGQEIA